MKENNLRQGLQLPQEGLKNLLNKPPVINEEQWNNKNLSLNQKIENAIGNHISNVVQELIDEYNNLEKEQYQMVDNINKDLKEKQKFDLSGSMNILEDFNDLDSLNKSKSVRGTN